MKHSAKKTILVLAAVLVCGQSMLTSCVEDIFDNPCHVIIHPFHTKSIMGRFLGCTKFGSGSSFFYFCSEKEKSCPHAVLWTFQRFNNKKMTL